VFKKSFIPRSLFDVVDAERDAQKVAAGDTDDVRPRLPSRLSLFGCLAYLIAGAFDPAPALGQLLYAGLTGLALKPTLAAAASTATTPAAGGAGTVAKPSAKDDGAAAAPGGVAAAATPAPTEANGDADGDDGSSDGSDSESPSSEDGEGEEGGSKGAMTKEQRKVRPTASGRPGLVDRLPNHRGRFPPPSLRTARYAGAQEGGQGGEPREAQAQDQEARQEAQGSHEQEQGRQVTA